MSGAFTINRGFPTPPPQAVAAGYTKLVFFDDFDSMTTVDINNTKAPGFLWYVSPFRSDSVTYATAGDLSMSSSLLVINPSVPSTVASGHIARIVSAGYAGSNTFVGNVFSGHTGFMIEARFLQNPANSPGSTINGWPTFWSNSVEFFCAQAAGISGVVGGEFDIMELFPSNVTGTVLPDLANHLSSSPSTNIATVLNSFPQSGLTWTNMNEFAVLVVPMARNNGTGICKRYINGVHQASYDLTWTAGSTWSPLETNNFCIVLDTGYKWPSTYHWVAVWGPP